MIIILVAIIVLSVVAHGFFWWDSKRTYKGYLEQVKALRDEIKEHENTEGEIDRMFDEAEQELQKIDDDIQAMRSILLPKKKMTTFDN